MTTDRTIGADDPIGGIHVDRGTARTLANGTPVGANAVVTAYGWGTVRWNPPPSTRPGHYRLTVRYDGGDKDVTAGTRSPAFTVRVR